MKGLRYIGLFFLISILFGAAAATSVKAQVEEKIDTREKRDVILYRGDLVSLKVYSLTRIAISTPGVVDIVSADVDEILLVGNALGQTQIFIWDEYGKRSVLARVMEHDLDMIKERIEQLLNSAGIKGVKMENSAYEAKIIATGKVNKSQKEVFDRVVSDFGAYVINMVDAQGDLIQIDAQVTELSKTLTQILGVEWSESLSGEETALPDSGFGNFFRVASMDRKTLIQATVHAMLQTGEAKTLSRPSLVMSDGETANIMVGGEIPTKTTTISDGVVTETTTYRTYGVEFSVTPEIKDNEKVDILLNISISDPDATFDEGSAFLTTATQTRVLLDDGQTIIIAGLIKQSELLTEKKVPFLSSIPIIGAAFRYKNYVKAPDREIVITLTPNIRRQSNKLKTERELEEEARLKERAQQMAEEAASAEKAPALDFELEQIDVTGQETAAPDFEIEEDLDAVLRDIEQAAMRDISLEGSGEISPAVSAYARAVQQKIARRISFPYEAKEKGWEGVVTLSLKILSDGQLNDVSVKDSSGYQLFDSDAVNTARIVSPYDPFPVEIEQDEITVFVPVSYSQDAFLIK